MSDIRKLPVQAAPTAALPVRIMWPCDYGLLGAVRDMETQIGTVEAYNRLCEAAARLKRQVDDGKAKIPHERWLIDPNWIYPASGR